MIFPFLEAPAQTRIMGELLNVFFLHMIVPDPQKIFQVLQPNNHRMPGDIGKTRLLTGFSFSLIIVPS
jgi:hypothetical protein